jgi:hypothetical protein
MSKYLSPLLVAALLTLAGSASAEISSSPGTNCVAADGTTPVPAMYWDGEIGNPSTTATLWVNCPVITNASAPVITRAQLTFLDRNNTQNASCTFNSQWVDSGGVVWFYQSAPMSSSGFASGPQTPPFTTPNFGAWGQNSQFQCSIPPKTSNGVSTIFRYEYWR